MAGQYWFEWERKDGKSNTKELNDKVRARLREWWIEREKTKTTMEQRAAILEKEFDLTVTIVER